MGIPKTVVVTGSAGFLGNAVVHALSGRGVHVVPVSRRPNSGIVQVSDYADTPAGDILIHLAEERDRNGAQRGGEAYERAASNTLKALIAKGWKRVVYVSSAVLYSDEFVTPRKPDDPIQVHDIYTSVKRAGEKAVLLSAGNGVVARLTNIYGPGMAPNNVVSDILGQMSESGPVHIRDVSPVRDFLWVTDAAEAIAIMATADTGRPGIYNVGTGYGTSIGGLANLAIEIAGCVQRQVVGTQSQGRLSCIVPDIAETERTWHWQPRVNLRQGLTMLLNSMNRDTQRQHG